MARMNLVRAAGHSRIVSAGGGAALMLMLMTAITVASAHGGDTTKIHACVYSSTGQLRIVGANETCKKTEQALDWNQAGVPGPAGAPGERGPAGPSGGVGPQGPSGVLSFYTRHATADLLGSLGGTQSGDQIIASCDPGDRAVGGGTDTITVSDFGLNLPPPPSNLPIWLDAVGPNELGSVPEQWLASFHTVYIAPAYPLNSPGDPSLEEYHYTFRVNVVCADLTP